MITHTSTTIMTVSATIMVGIFFGFSHIKNLRDYAEKYKVDIDKTYKRREKKIYSFLMLSLLFYAISIALGVLVLFLDELEWIPWLFDITSILFFAYFSAQFTIFFCALLFTVGVLVGLIRVTNLINIKIW